MNKRTPEQIRAYVQMPADVNQTRLEELGPEKYRNRLFYIDEVRQLINSLLKEEISIGRFVEILNEKSTGLHPLQIASIKLFLNHRRTKQL